MSHEILHSRRQNGDTKQVSYWEPTDIRHNRTKFRPRAIRRPGFAHRSLYIWHISTK